MEFRFENCVEILQHTYVNTHQWQQPISIQQSNAVVDQMETQTFQTVIEVLCYLICLPR